LMKTRLVMLLVHNSVVHLWRYHNYPERHVMIRCIVIHRLATVSMNPQTAIASCRTITHSWPLPTMNNIKAPYKILYFGWQISCMAQRGLQLPQVY
jgi:hypothetical protein